MKKTKIILLVFVICLIPFAGHTQFNETREYNREFKVMPETRIEITNKYGNLVVNTWEKDSVIFNIKVNVEEKKLSKLEKTMEGIDFEFIESSHFLIAKTIVNKSSSALEKELLKFKESLLNDEGNVEIDYTIWMPENCDLILDNKYGNIFMSDFTGNCEITLSNGNLKAHNLLGITNINLNFADATINKLTTSRLKTNYSEVEIDTSEKLKIDSKQSNFEFFNTSELDIISRRDKFRIRKAGIVEAEGSFTGFRISELKTKANIRADYGDINIEYINPDFDLIFIESKSTDINLYFEPESNFGFELTKTKIDIDMCREIEITDEVILDEKNQKIKVSGKFGEKQPETDKLFINSTLGSVNIYSK
ncbi:MAG: hypothetical protein JXR31_16055 [Prolixibacteraceae bacterium]|nr:hypothetical protein [Prolixibacteraceae bacterium]MBN2775770.1 hypothetical protein [Prolixibacteraceae bacterium]